MRCRPPTPRWLLGLLVCLLFVASALATTARPVEVECPVCDHEFTAWQLGSTNSFGGTDFDLCTHARGSPPQSYYVWVCPSCRYANWDDEFRAGVTEATAQRIRAGLVVDHPFDKDTRQMLIPAWVKYELLIQVLELEGKTVPERARALQLLVWAPRVECSDLLDPVREHPDLGAHWEAAAKSSWEITQLMDIREDDGMDLARREIFVAESVLSRAPAAEPLSLRAQAELLYAAYLLRNRGENIQAVPVLERLAARADDDKAVALAARGLLASIDRERVAQGRSMAFIEAGLNEGAWEPSTAAVMAYQVAETRRRLASRDEAGTWYERVVRDPAAPAWLFRTTRERLELDFGGRLSTAQFDALWDAQFAHLVEMLHDPEQSREAGAVLLASGDPRALPELVGALSTDDDEVRYDTARIFRDIPSPPPAAIEALCEILSRPHDGAGEHAARALLSIGPPEAHAAFTTALDSEDDDIVRVAVEGLGMIGSEVDVPVLVELYDIYPEHARTIAEALSRLTGSDVKSLPGFADWWKPHASETREQWATIALKRAGLDQTDRTTQQLVPPLLDLLEHESATLRFVALRRLRELTSQSFGWTDLGDDAEYPRAIQERARAVAAWRDWWKTQ